MVRRVVLGLLGLHLASMVQSCGVLFAPIAPFLRPPIVLSNIEAPKTAKRGTPVTVRLFATVGDGCGVFRQAGAWVSWLGVIDPPVVRPNGSTLVRPNGSR